MSYMSKNQTRLFFFVWAICILVQLFFLIVAISLGWKILVWAWS